MGTVSIQLMDPADITRIGEIDRSEHISLLYKHEDGRLVPDPAELNVPRWPDDPEDSFGVQAKIAEWKPILDEGGVMIGAFDGDRLVGSAILRYRLTGTQAQLAALYISNGYRRQGIAQRLTAEIYRLARESGATEICVSAIPSESAVGFYRSEGFELAKEPNKELFELEPEDIHMIKQLQGT